MKWRAVFEGENEAATKQTLKHLRKQTKNKIN